MFIISTELLLKEINVQWCCCMCVSVCLSLSESVWNFCQSETRHTVWCRIIKPCTDGRTTNLVFSVSRVKVALIMNRKLHAHDIGWEVVRRCPLLQCTLKVCSFNIWFFFSPDVNECSSEPCENGATCEDVVDGYICHCADGYEGVHCELGTLWQRSLHMTRFESHSSFTSFK